MKQHASTHSSHPCSLPLRIGLAGLFLLAFALSSPAQAPGPGSAPMLKRAQAMLEHSRATAAALQEEVLSLDRDIDASVDELVTMLKGVQDSTESKTKVMDVKKEAIESLEKWLQAYAQERGRRLGQLQGPGGAAAREDLQGEVESIDAEIDKRVDQIVELAASMSTSEDVKRYEKHYQDWGVAKVETDAYRANKRQVSHADQSQSKVAKDLEKAIAGIERDIALVPQRLPRDQQEAELERLQKLLEERRGNLRDLATAYPAEAHQVGKREADQLKRDLGYVQEDVRALWSRLLAKANALSVERQRIRQLKARVKALAEEMEPPSAPEVLAAPEVPEAPAAPETSEAPAEPAPAE